MKKAVDFVSAAGFFAGFTLTSPAQEIAGVIKHFG